MCALRLSVAYNLKKAIINECCDIFKTFLNVVFCLWCFCVI